MLLVENTLHCYGCPALHIIMYCIIIIISKSGSYTSSLENFIINFGANSWVTTKLLFPFSCTHTKRQTYTDVQTDRLHEYSCAMELTV